MRWWMTLAGTALLLAALPCPGGTPPVIHFGGDVPSPCSCCQQMTLRQWLEDTVAVVYGTLTRATPDNPVKGTGNGITDLVIEKTLVPHAILKGRTTITLDRYLPPQKDKPNGLFLVDRRNGQLVVSRRLTARKGSDLPTYVTGFLKVKDEKPAKRLRFYFDYLNHAEAEIANDALHEFRASDYKDYRDLAAHLPGEKLAAWLRDPKTPGDRI